MWIGISGKAGSGKTTLARKLAGFFDTHSWQIVPFATPVKELAAIAGNTNYGYIQRVNLIFAYLLLLNPMKNDSKHLVFLENVSNGLVHLGNKYPNIPKQKNRKLLQLIGTEYGRNVFGENVWVDYVKARLSNSAITISDDVRFNNEAEAVDLHIHIDHNADIELYNVRSFYSNTINDHVSENSLTTVPDVVLPIGYDDTIIKQFAGYIAFHLSR